MPIENLVTPVGRIVWGNPAVAQKKTDQQTGAVIMKDGQPVMQWSFGLAIPKDQFNQHVLPYLQQEAATLYPQGFPPKFAWKFKDGDGVDSQGKPYSAREGYAGCYVLTVSTEAFAPSIFKMESNGWRQMAPEEVKCGHYVSVSLNVKANAPKSAAHTPGLYINPNGIEWVAYGAEILGAVKDPNEMFSGKQHQLPPGASLTPVAASGGAAMPGTAHGAAPAGYPGQPAPAPAGYPGQPAPAAAPQGYPQPAAAPQPAPAGYAPQPAAPAYGQPAPGYPQPAPAGYAPQPQTGAGYAPQAYAAAPQPAPAGYPAPAHDFVHNAAGVMPGTMPPR